MGIIEQISVCIPGSPEDEIPWNQIDSMFAASVYSDMKTIMQNPVYHGEGDVYAHTQMMCNELARDPAFYELTVRQRNELFLAAILHDIGKVKTTRLDGGNWVSPHHASTGSQMARAFLWQEYNLCGTKEMVAFRETVCALICYHMLPVHLMDQEEPERKVREVAAVGELAEDFSWHLLCMLAEADLKGRIANDIPDGRVQVEMARVMAEEAECLYAPYHFADDFTKHAYLSGRNVQPDQTLFDDTWGEVIMLSGLPGTGKDTWIRNHHPDMPMVSLDGFRIELGIKPTDNQGAVIQAAKERAKEYLRKKHPFIWNATDLTKDTRKKWIGLFERYGARVRIVYLETEEKNRESRNSGRCDSVPEGAVARMLVKTVLPTPDEAQKVEWLYV